VRSFGVEGPYALKHVRDAERNHVCSGGCQERWQPPAGLKHPCKAEVEERTARADYEKSCEFAAHSGLTVCGFYLGRLAHFDIENC
jgi:hypothetical protein